MDQTFTVTGEAEKDQPGGSGNQKARLKQGHRSPKVGMQGHRPDVASIKTQPRGAAITRRARGSKP